MITKRAFLRGAVLASASAPFARIAFAATPEVFTNRGQAIRGYDPVAYFTEGKPVRGSDSHTHNWNGAEWRFSSEENRAAFAANPEAYAPQYGGYCAWAVAEGYTASTDPDAWKIVDNKLYLNYSAGVQRRWERDILGNISRGDSNWPAVLK
ncbi:MAG: YHS domain-containing (seleno)protein [Pseudomonadota bacterium]